MLDDMKLKDVMQLVSLLQDKKESPVEHWQIGKAYFIRTVASWRQTKTAVPFPEPEIHKPLFSILQGES